MFSTMALHSLGCFYPQKIDVDMKSWDMKTCGYEVLG